MISKEQNIRLTMESINNIKRAEADPLLDEKIIQRNIPVIKNNFWEVLKFQNACQIVKALLLC